MPNERIILPVGSVAGNCLGSVAMRVAIYGPRAVVMPLMPHYARQRSRPNATLKQRTEPWHRTGRLAHIDCQEALLSWPWYYHSQAGLPSDIHMWRPRLAYCGLRIQGGSIVLSPGPFGARS